MPSVAYKTLPAIKTRNGRNPMDLVGSHWIMAGTNNNKDKTWLDSVTDATADNFEAVVIRYYWSDLEGAGSGTTSGAFDFSEVGRMLDYCHERGIFVSFMIMWRNFSTALGDVMPGDLVTNFQSTAAGGFISAIYESTGVVRTRYSKCVQALVDRFKDHPYFFGVQTNETSGFTTCTAEAYSKVNAETQLNLLYGSLIGYAPGVQVQVGWNFLNGSATLATAKQTWSNVFGDSAANNSPANRFAWLASTAYSVDDAVYMAHRKFVCTVAGTSASSAPTWSTTTGGLTTDGGVTWETLVTDFIIWFPDIVFDDFSSYGALNNRTFPLTDSVYSGDSHWLFNVWMVGSMQFDSYLGMDWKPSTAYYLDDIVAEGGKQQKCTTAGTSGASAPTWATVDGNTTNDGTVVWTAGSTASPAIYSCVTHPPGNGVDWNMHNLFVEGRDRLGIRGVIWTYQNSRRYKFDTPNSGKTYGDAVAVARKAWTDSYDQGYAD